MTELLAVDPAPVHRRGPIVSVVLSVYNGEEYLQAAMDSILSQTYSEFEVIAINDGSTDQSGRYLDEYSARDPRVRVIHQENAGLTVSLNRGIALARGKYIARMDADDLSYPERLERQVAVLERDSDVVLVTTTVDRIDAHGSTLWGVDRSEYSSPLSWYMMFFNVLGAHGQVMFRRDAAVKVGGYDESIPTSQDYDLWWRLASCGRYEFLPERLYAYRLHPGAISTSKAALQRSTSFAISNRIMKECAGFVLDDSIRHDCRLFWQSAHTSSDTSITKVLAVERALRKALAGYMDRAQSDHSFRKDAITVPVSRRYSSWARRVSLRRPVCFLLLYLMARSWSRASIAKS